ncbi:hypothetical protein TPHA_0J00640 [Tetrapisispora phaffii CBS 4417]|uniref:Uncharacterized protein n=1 Tax=Tetrapisispora phaffii (strain ATCC 24235 / CBS 4417 / NBRC 1672 / NRRL Y-8282 / UCD 70-5) TaxID=1071381 RepID=G8BYE5_TETPH|nr:hypothetical protein TPHA_0J00640 [Tetrapisispora phaffii CBS 4417]CCE64887.1 hypothetical protein TPHA_0J00640 [Tetrapisispora phaffii CBS 4417]
MTTIPPEIIYQILTYQFRDYMNNDHPNSPEKFNENLRMFLRSNLTVNKYFYHICKILIYRYCNFTTAKRFNSILNTFKQNELIRNIIEVADFQELTSIGLGRTGEMNKLIKNLTNETLFEFLDLTKSTLREFLACEHIQGDLDCNIIYMLLKPGTVLSVLDFCGCSGAAFTEAFIKGLDKLYEDKKGIDNAEPIETNYQLSCLGLNDCTDLPPIVISRTIRLFPELQKLDLSHTSISDDTIRNFPHFRNLTHLSFAMCSKVSTRVLLEFFAHHPAVSDENNLSTLEWLNVRVSPHASSWTEVHTMFLLKKLCRFGHNKTLQYLNIGGFPIHESDNMEIIKTRYYYKCQDTLRFIKWNFLKLRSLSLKDNNIPIETLCKFLSIESMKEDDLITEYEMGGLTMNNKISKESKTFFSQKLKYLNISNNSFINKWTIQNSNLFTSSPYLQALEVSFEAWRVVESLNEKHELTAYIYANPDSNIKDIAAVKEVKWKCYLDSSYGRRYWLYKADPYLNRGDLDSVSNIIRYDQQGNKIVDIVKQPDFLKYAQAKIMLGCGLAPLSGVRRRKCYRDSKPPISHFLSRNGGISFGQRAEPIRTPRLPPGGWRMVGNDGRHTELANIGERQERTIRTIGEITPSTNHHPREEPLIPRPGLLRTANTAGLYWDRSMQDIHALSIDPGVQEIEMGNSSELTVGDMLHSNLADEIEENDEDYLLDPSLQRRRSHLHLMRSYFSHSNLDLSGTGNLETQQLHKKQLKPRNAKNLNYDHPDSYVYDKEDSEITKRYRMHFEQVNEYQVFGSIERGMYRYYSLKT